MRADQLTPRDKIERAKVDIQGDQPFFSYLVTNAEFQPDRNLPALAGVKPTGKGYYNPDKVDGISMDETRGLVLHETLHLAFKHPWRDYPDHWDSNLVELAQEMEVQGRINLETDYDLPEGGVMPEEGDNFAMEVRGQWVEIEDTVNKGFYGVYKELERQLDDDEQ